MRNQLFVPDFIFDFYSDRGSIGTPSALSNVNSAKVPFSPLCPYLAMHYTKSKKPREMIFTRLIAGWELY